MNNKEFAQFKERCQYSKTIYEKMKNGSFINDKVLMAELMDDSKLTGGVCPRHEPRVGEQYQVKLLYKKEIKYNKKESHNYNLRSNS